MPNVDHNYGNLIVWCPNFDAPVYKRTTHARGASLCLSNSRAYNTLNEISCTCFHELKIVYKKREFIFHCKVNFISFSFSIHLKDVDRYSEV